MKKLFLLLLKYRASVTLHNTSIVCFHFILGKTMQIVEISPEKDIIKLSKLFLANK